MLEVLVSLTSGTFPLLSTYSSPYPPSYGYTRSTDEDNPYSHSLIPSYESGETDYKDEFDDQYERSIGRSFDHELADESHDSTNHPSSPHAAVQVEETWTRNSPENDSPSVTDEGVPVEGFLASGKLNGVPVAGLLVKSSEHEGGIGNHNAGVGDGNGHTVSLFVSKPIHLLVGNPVLLSNPPTVGHHHSYGAHGSLSINGHHADHPSGGHGGFFSAIGSLSGGYSPIATPYGYIPHFDARLMEEVKLLQLKENERSDFHGQPKPVVHHLRTPSVPDTSYPTFPKCRKAEPHFFLGRVPLANTPESSIHQRGDFSSIRRHGLIYDNMPNSQVSPSNDAYVPYIPQPSPLLPPQPYLHGISAHSASSSPAYQHYLKYEEARNPDGNNTKVSTPVIEANTETDKDDNKDSIPTVNLDDSQKSAAVTELPSVSEVNSESNNDLKTVEDS
ncbi:uncharacterized protein LOC124357594 [Homalodisca vitripennis]|uniref:uncharacterized protein LOC124357594 n=1 Tax=Homalodisca vitripennis TaxID=197043 RepID=UPI001EEB12EF|nr:uncharacterized protein LOC124357594 [Homalodisca vitripennis]